MPNREKILAEALKFLLQQHILQSHATVPIAVQHLKNLKQFDIETGTVGDDSSSSST